MKGKVKVNVGAVDTYTSIDHHRSEGRSETARSDETQVYTETSDKLAGLDKKTAVIE